MGDLALTERGGLAIVNADEAANYIRQLQEAREALERGGFDTVAVANPEDSSGHILARDLGGLAISSHDDYLSVLRASKTGRMIASVLPLQIKGEPSCVPFNGDGKKDKRSTLAAIGDSRSFLVTKKIHLPYALENGKDTTVTMAIVSNYNGI